MADKNFTWVKYPKFYEKLAFLWDRQYSYWQYARKQHHRDDVIAVALWPALFGEKDDRLLVELNVAFADGARVSDIIILDDREYSPLWEIDVEVRLATALMNLLKGHPKKTK